MFFKKYKINVKIFYYNQSIMNKYLYIECQFFKY